MDILGKFGAQSTIERSLINYVTVEPVSIPTSEFFTFLNTWNVLTTFRSKERLIFILNSLVPDVH